jgi:hypothetical protein
MSAAFKSKLCYFNGVPITEILGFMLLNIIAYNNWYKVSYIIFDGYNWPAVFKTNYTEVYFCVL